MGFEIMKKKVWIWNHYATNMLNDMAGRHYWFAENLIKKGYDVTIFCASTIHNTSDVIETYGRKYISKKVKNIPFVVVDTPQYFGNGKKRIINMLSFYKKLFAVSTKYAEDNGKPDVIIASSVHPFTLMAGIKVAKKFGIPCICEVRDLWPESIVAYGLLKKDSILAKILYRIEKYIYIKAEFVIMTWEGGSQYILEQGWEDQIDLSKVKHISNGVVIDSFDKNMQENKITDLELMDNSYKNLVYTGSIRTVNNLGVLLDVAKIIWSNDVRIRFIIYGSGDEEEILKKRCIDEGIKNVFFKGRVDKKVIPSILEKSYANILHNSSTPLDKYGQSQNKFFEYLAAGKCIIQTYTTGYSILEKYKCGVSAIEQTPENIAEIILKLCNDEEEAKQMGLNARKAAYDFDFANLTNELIKIIENT